MLPATGCSTARPSPLNLHCIATTTPTTPRYRCLPCCGATTQRRGGLPRIYGYRGTDDPNISVIVPALLIVSICFLFWFLPLQRSRFSKLYHYSLSYGNTTILIHHISEIYHWLCLLWPLFGTTTDVPYGPKCLRYTPPSLSLSLYSLCATETVCWLLYHCFKLIWPLCHYCRLPSHFSGLFE